MASTPTTSPATHAAPAAAASTSSATTALTSATSTTSTAPTGTLPILPILPILSILSIFSVAGIPVLGLGFSARLATARCTPSTCADTLGMTIVIVNGTLCATVITLRTIDIFGELNLNYD